MEETTKKIPFEVAIAELEQIVMVLEKGDVTLDEMIEAYTKGMKLVQLCSEQLDRSQAVVDKLLTIQQGAVKEEALVIEEAD